MRVMLIIIVVLGLASPYLTLAEQPGPRYTTLIVEYVGEMDKPVFPLLISTSSEEGEWYRQHVIPKFFRDFARVDVVPESVLSEIAGLPLLRHTLESTKSSNEEPKMAQNVRFTAGVGHVHAR